MEIKNKTLISVSASDIINGKFVNKTVTSVANGCFHELRNLISVSLPKVTEIGSYCFRYNQALTEINLPALTTAGSDCFRYNQALTEINLPALTTAGSDCFRYNQALTEINLKQKKYSIKSIDGSCFVIAQEKSAKGIKIYSGYNLLTIEKGLPVKENSFVAEKNSFYAHGETVKKAISDLQFKIASDKLKNEPINADTRITINHYRLITGACEMGVNSFINQTFTESEKVTILENGIKASDLLPILRKKGAYGLDRFESLISF